MQNKITVPFIGAQIIVRADGDEIEGNVTGHSEKDGKSIIDYLGPCKLSSGLMSQPTTRWAWVDQINPPSAHLQEGSAK